MAVNVRIPTTMRPITGGDKLVSLEPGSLSEVIAALEKPSTPAWANASSTKTAHCVSSSTYSSTTMTSRYLNGLDTAVQDNWTVSIIPAVAGG